MQVLCGQCGKTLTVADALAGGTLPCPHCGHRIQLPAFGETPAEVAQVSNGMMEVTLEDLHGSAPHDDDGFADLARKSMVRKVRVRCVACKKALTLGGRHWGQTIKCPGCGASLRVPHPDGEFDQPARIGSHDDDDVEPLDVHSHALVSEVGASDDPACEAMEQVAELPVADDAPPPVARKTLPANDRNKATKPPAAQVSRGLPRWVIYAVIGVGAALAATVIPTLVNRAYNANATAANAPANTAPITNAPAANVAPTNASHD